MKFIRYSLAIGLGLASGAAFAATTAAMPATLYPMPHCGCCGSYATYLDHHGFNVHEEKISSTNVLEKIATQDDVPVKFIKQPMKAYSGICHITQVGGYVVVGHVPANVVHRLLSRRPKNIAGLILPGMPPTSPGMLPPGSTGKSNMKMSGMQMNGMKKARKPLVVYAFDSSGKTWVYEKVHATPPYAPIQ